MLNIFLLLLLLVDTGWLVLKITTKNYGMHFQDDVNLKPYTGDPKPDIYLIIADEYAGNNELKDLFNFDNSNFERALSQKGFHVITNTSSNYNYTALSMASSLNLSYLKLITYDQKNNLVKALISVKKTAWLIL
ncbi:MAG: hypothetical protein ABUL41_01910 [Chitinophagaceae bacterium]